MQRGNRAGRHQDALCVCALLRAGRGIGFRLDFVHQRIVAFRPSLVAFESPVCAETGVLGVLGISGVFADVLTQTRIVVAGRGDEDFKEVYAIVEVCNPAHARRFRIALAELDLQGRPCFGVDHAGDADLVPAFLYILDDGGVGGVLVEGELEGRNISELDIAAFDGAGVAVASVDQHLDGFDLIYGVLRIFFGGRCGAFIPGAVFRRFANVLVIAVGQHLREETGRCDFAAHGDVFYFILTIDQHAQRLTNLGLLLNGQGLAFGRHILVNVEQHIVGAQLFAHHQFIAVGGGQTFKLGGIHAFDEGNRAGFISGQDCHGVLGEMRLYAAQGYLIGIPVVGVLFKGCSIVNRIRGHAERTHADVLGRIGRPCARIVRHINLYRIEGGEAAQIEEICAGIGQGDHQRACIIIRNHVQRSILIVGDVVEQIAVVRTQFGAGSAVPALHKIACEEIGAIGPLQVFAENEGIYQTILGNRVGFRQFGLILIHFAVNDLRAHQTAERQTDGVGTGGRGVERRVKGLRRAAAVHNFDDFAFCGRGDRAEGQYHQQGQNQSKYLFHDCSSSIWMFCIHTRPSWADESIG